MSNPYEKVAAWIRAHELIIEFILAALVACAGVIKFLHLAGADDILQVTMLTLAGFYFLSGFLQKGERAIRLGAARLFAITSSICVVGLLFTFLQMPGASQQLFIGLLSLVPCGIALIILAVNERSQKIIPMFVRLVVLGGLSLNAWLALEASGAV